MDEKVGDDSQSDDDGFLSWSQRASCIMGNGNIERRASTVPHISVRPGGALAPWCVRGAAGMAPRRIP